VQKRNYPRMSALRQELPGAVPIPAISTLTKCDLPGQKPAAWTNAAKSASGAVKSVPDLATLTLATLTVAIGCRRIHAPHRIIIAEDPNAGQRSESGQRGRPW
jgi:hypothetical protein